MLPPDGWRLEAELYSPATNKPFHRIHCDLSSREIGQCVAVTEDAGLTATLFRDNKGKKYETRQNWFSRFAD